jgi:hypothetical protein
MGKIRMQDETERESFRNNIGKKDFFPQGPPKGELFPSKVVKNMKTRGPKKWSKESIAQT